MRWLILVLALLLVVPPASAETEDFGVWLKGFRQDAIAQGIAPATLDRALAGVQPIPRIIELDQAQPESVLTFSQYLDRIANPARRDAARKHYLDNKALLDEIGQRYGVQPCFIVALWGIETDFGASIGKYSVVSALATLAYDGRRSAFFRRELINALLIIQKDKIEPASMIGSWAGAMGQSQFMPSSFLAYAVSYRGQGAPDIWKRTDDVFASIANYLSHLGWHDDRGWGETVTLPAGFDQALIGFPQKRSVADWAALGVRRSDGSALPSIPPGSDWPAAVLRPGGDDGPSLLVYDNFSAILKWNSSSYFATAVGYLADSVN